MRKFVCIALLSCALAAAGRAQRSLGYWFAAPGAITSQGRSMSSVHLGGGGEIALLKGVTLGIEGGAVATTARFTDSVQGVASLNGYYHFRPATARLDPFATVGYSLLFRRGTANLVNFGGGLNWWFAQKLAWRVEFRDHVQGGTPAAIHYWGVRLGLSFTEFAP